MSTTAPALPDGVVVVGTHTGVAVLAVPTPLTRLRYYDGRFLRAADMTLHDNGGRALARFVARPGGKGVVFGFDVTRGDGDALVIGPGLAVDADGAVLHLPVSRAIPVADLLAPAGVASGPGTAVAGGPGVGGFRFAPCDVDDPGGTTVTATQTGPFFLVTISHVEGACGLEPVYASLCEDACVSDVERPYLVEGVLVRLEPVALALSSEGAPGVVLTAAHHRNLAASRYFAIEEAGGDLLSAAGLASRVFCAGAPPEAGTAIPIALVERAGGTTRMLDQWAVRRELMETPSRRYWAGRLSMRPWPAFLAQVLQFQCQYADVAVAPGEGRPATDPCADANTLLETSLRSVERARTALKGRRAVADRAAYDELGELVERLGRQTAVAPSRRLVDRGFVELPPAGFLAVTAGPVEDQVRNAMGEGADLRFCVIRADQVGGELEAAQHLDRISLLRGLRDPARREAVDILVPDGEIAAVPAGPSGAMWDVDLALIVPGGAEASVKALAGLHGTLTAAVEGDPQVALDQLHEVAQQSRALLPLRGMSRVAPSGSDGFSFALGTVAAVGAQRTGAELAGGLLRAVGDPLADVRFPEVAPQPLFGDRVREVGAAALGHAVRREYAAAGAGGAPGRFAVRPRRDAAELGFLVAAVAMDRDPLRMTSGEVAVVDLDVILTFPSDPAHSIDVRLAGGRGTLLATSGAGVALEVSGSWIVRTQGVMGDVTSDEPGRIAIARGRQDRMATTTIDIAPPAGAAALRLASGVRDDGALSMASLVLGTASAKAAMVAVQRPLGLGIGARAEGAGTDARRELAQAAVNAATAARDAALGRRLQSLLFGDAAAAPTVPRVTAVHDWVMFRRRTRRDCEAPPVPVAPPDLVGVYGAVAGARDRRRLLALVRRGSTAGFTRIDVAQFDDGTAVLRPGQDLAGRWSAALGSRDARVAVYTATPGSLDPVGRERADAVRAAAGLLAGPGYEALEIPASTDPGGGQLAGRVFLLAHPPEAPAEATCIELLRAGAGGDVAAFISAPDPAAVDDRQAAGEVTAFGAIRFAGDDASADDVGAYAPQLASFLLRLNGVVVVWAPSDEEARVAGGRLRRAIDGLGITDRLREQGRDLDITTLQAADTGTWRCPARAFFLTAG